MDKAITKQANDVKLKKNLAFWSDEYETRLKDLFEAIVSENIHKRPSPDEVTSVFEK